MTVEDRNAVGAGAYVLNAMDDVERAEFETQLAESEDLRNEVTELTDTAVLLGLAVEPVLPSPALKQNIMARLGQIPQLDREDAPGRPLRAVPPLVVESVSPPQPPRVTSRKAQARWYSRPIVALTAAAAAVVLIAGAVVGTNIATQSAHTSQQADALAAIMSASDVQRAEASVSTGGMVTLIWSLKTRKSALAGAGLKVLPAGKTYELWYVDSAGKPTAAGLFQSNGKNMLQVLNGQMDAGDTVGVSVEPSGGSKAPTTKPIVAISSA